MDKKQIIKFIENIREELNREHNNSKEDYFLFHRDRYYKTLKVLDKEYKNIHCNPKLLDIGSHYCHLPMMAGMIGYDVYGTDLEEFVNLEQNQDKYKKYNLKIKICNLEKDKIPFEDNFFDICLFTEILEHLNFYPLRVFKEINRVLKQEGLFIITTPNLFRLANKIKILINKSIYSDIKKEYFVGTHFREYSKKEIIYLLNQSGFDLKDGKYINFKYPNESDIIYMIKSCIGFFVPLLKNNLLILAKKK